MLKTKKIALIAILFFAAPILHAQNDSHTLRSTYPDRGEDLIIKIAVFGPGTEAYFWYGHIAIIIENPRTGRNSSYDFGLFAFENEKFFRNFAFGRMWYSIGVVPAAHNIAGYVNSNRDVTLYTLDLPPDRREEMLYIAEQNVLPENRNYLYHFFDDNCSTRIRDIIDAGTYGQFREKFENEEGRYTIRRHVRRHTWRSPFTDWILNFWMGQGIDTPITVWDEMFLPSEVGKNIAGFTYTDSYGNTRKLVSNINHFYQSEGRFVPLETPRERWPQALALSLALSIVLCFLFYVQALYPAAGQVALGVCHTLFGLVFGVAGFLLFFMSFFTSHDYTYNNINLLFGNPLLLVAVHFGIRYASADCYNKRITAEIALRLVWLLTALGIFISMLLKLSPNFWQQNLTDQVLMLPIALTLSLEPFGIRRLVKRLSWHRLL